MRFSVVVVLGAFAVCPGCGGAGAAEDPTEGAAVSSADPTREGAPLGATADAEHGASERSEHVGTGAAACWWWGPPPHGVVADDVALAAAAVAR
jgi:hypothetical protein